MRKLTSLVFLLLITVHARAWEPPRIGAEPQLFFDDQLIERLDGIRRVLHSPQRREISLVFDAPWEGPQSGYATVLRAHDGGYRMYYRGGGESSHESVCVAFSHDGIHWKRPHLGIVELGGTRDNNILIRPQQSSYREAHNFAPFLDGNPNADPEQRYKALGLARRVDPRGEGHRALAAFVSADGIRWRRLRDEPVMSDGSFDSLNTVFWDPNLGKYVCYLRAGRDGVRSIQRSVSDDFVNWSEPRWLEFGDAPPEHLYTNGIIPYFRAPRIYLGFPMRFVPQRKTVGADDRAIDGTSDALFMFSHDGLRWTRFAEAFIRPGPDPANWGNAHGNQTPVWGILPHGETEISVYWTEHYGTSPRIVRGVVRADGFVSLRADAGGGGVITRPIVLDGEHLAINFATSAVGSARVEIQDDAGRPIPGFAMDDCLPLWGDEIDRVVRWHDGASLERLKGRPVRLRIALNDADLYSFRARATAED